MGPRQKKQQVDFSNNEKGVFERQGQVYLNTLNLGLQIFSAQYAQLSFLQGKSLMLVACAGSYGSAVVAPELEMECFERDEVMYFDQGNHRTALCIPFCVEGDKWAVLAFYSTSKFDYNLNKRPLIEGLKNQLVDSYHFKKNEQAFLEQKLKTHAIYEGASDSIILITGEGIVDCNQRCLQMFGYQDKHEILGLHPATLSPQTQPCGKPSYLLAQKRIQHAIKKGSLSFQWLHQRKDGTPFYCEILLSAFELDGRQMVQASVRDIDKKIKLEQKLEKFQNTLLEMSFIDPQFSKDQKIRKILELSANALRITRASFWSFDERCEKIKTPYIYSLEKREFLPGAQISRNEYPHYFNEILERRSVVSNDAKRDATLFEFRENYLEELNIGAMLDNIVHHQGKSLGILSHELVGGIYRWDVHEQAYACSVADRIAMILKDEEIKQHSEEVAKIKCLLEDVERNALIGGWEIDIETMEITWTHQTYQIYGIKNGIQVTLSDFVRDFSRNDQDIFLGAIKSAMTSSNSFENHLQLFSKNQQIKWLKIKGDVVCDLGKRSKIKGSIQDITEMKSREIELVATKDRINRIINSSPAVTYERTWDRHWQISYVSHHVYDLTGHTSNEILTNPQIIVNAIHPEDIEEINKVLISSAQTGNSYDIRYRFTHKNGELRWAWDRGGYSAENTITGVILDVTSEVKATEGVQNLKQALDESALISMTDLFGKITYVNKKFCELSGYEDYELIGKSHSFLKSGDHPLSFYKEMWGEISIGKTWRGQIKNKSKSGMTYWLDSVIYPLKGRDGLVKEFISITRDITRLKRLEKIEQFISKLRACFISYEESPDIFFTNFLNMILETFDCKYGFFGEVICDEHGNIDFKSCHFLGMSWNNEIKNFYQETYFKRAFNSREIFLTGLSESHSSPMDVPEGVPVLSSFAAIPVYFQDQLIAAIGLGNKEFGFYEGFVEEIGLAITVVGEMINAIRIKETLKKQNKILEHNAKLVSIGQLAAGVGHEINNPLAIMKGIVSLARDELDSAGAMTESVKLKMSRIDVSIDRIAAIVKGLRIFSRSDDSELTQFNIIDLVKEVEGLISEIYHNDGYEISFIYPVCERCDVFGNRGRIQQVLMNLISNAKDAVEGMEYSKIEVGLICFQDTVQLKVRDNGHGISDELKDRIFDPFFTTKDVNRGTGIGLSLVNTIVREHGGTIKLDSSLGAGAQFSVTLPLTSGPRKFKDLISSDISSVQKVFHLNALVVDDEGDLRDIFKTILSEMGFSVLLANNGEEALKILKENKIDIVISDIAMPVMNGKELVRKIKSDPSYDKIKLVLMSGDLALGSSETRELEDKEDAVIAKPFNVDQVKLTISRLFSDK